MEIKIIKIGSSKGIRIPSRILKDFNNPDVFKLNITSFGIFLKPIKKDTRLGWREAYLLSNTCLLENSYVQKNK